MVMWPDLERHPQHITHSSARSTSLLDGFPIVLGSVLLVAQEASGGIRSALITTSHRLIYGDLLFVAVIPGRCNGPSWLHDNESTTVNIQKLKEQQCITEHLSPF